MESIFGDSSINGTTIFMVWEIQFLILFQLVGLGLQYINEQYDEEKKRRSGKTGLRAPKGQRQFSWKGHTGSLDSHTNKHYSRELNPLPVHLNVRYRKQILQSDEL